MATRWFESMDLMNADMVVAQFVMVLVVQVPLVVLYNTNRMSDESCQTRMIIPCTSRTSGFVG